MLYSKKKVKIIFYREYLSIGRDFLQEYIFLLPHRIALDALHVFIQFDNTWSAMDYLVSSLLN